MHIVRSLVPVLILSRSTHRSRCQSTRWTAAFDHSQGQHYGSQMSDSYFGIHTLLRGKVPNQLKVGAQSETGMADFFNTFF